MPAGDTTDLPVPITAEWAWSGSTGRDVRVAVIDSGIEDGHPSVGKVQGWIGLEYDPEMPKNVRLTEGPHEDLVGHGTACAAIIRRLAPDCSLYSVRVLGRNLRTRGLVFAEGLRWAIENDMQVVNTSLSSNASEYFPVFHELADLAYFRGLMLVCALNNAPVASYPSQYSSVISVAAQPAADPLAIAYNPKPPAEFRAPGVDLEVAWRGGGSMRASGNSFAAPHITGVVARILSKHPGLKPFQMKTVLKALADGAISG